MNRAILEACTPCLTALAAASVLLVVVLKLSGGRWNGRRALLLHRCESGGVQSLSFVFTLPVLVIILLFIVQVSQLMTGIVVVNYAAYAAARASSVWIPAMVIDAYSGLGADFNDQNELPPGIAPGVPLALDLQSVPALGSRKYEKVWTAAALACAPIAPSRTTPDSATGLQYATRAISATQMLYPLFDPAGETNARMPQRIQDKLSYSFANTSVTILFEDRNSENIEGTRTYNMRADDYPPGGPPEETIVWYPSEVGWQDPITVTVYHDFALLPGAGRLLARVLTRYDGRSDQVAPRILQTPGLYKTRLKASATMTNEGIQSMKPYLHPGG